MGGLGGAAEEGDRILQLAEATSAIDVTVLRQKDATKAAVLAALRSGKYDGVHYAGHAFFDPQGPGRSGLVCAGREVLSGLDLAGISNLPLLVFFNACEAGRIRGRPAPPVKKASTQSYESAGVAEALMRGGIANYMSTYWPVGDDAAETFSETFYKAVLGGSTIGSALLAARKAVLGRRMSKFDSVGARADGTMRIAAWRRRTKSSPISASSGGGGIARQLRGRPSIGT